MTTKSISSTKAQNNFGRVLDDVTHHQNRYVIERRGVPQVIILGLDDFASLLNNAEAREHMDNLLQELRPEYHLGHIVEPIE